MHSTPRVLEICLHCFALLAGLAQGSIPCTPKDIQGVASCKVTGTINDSYGTLVIKVDQETTYNVVGRKFGVFADVVSSPLNRTGQASIFVSVAKGSSYFNFNSIINENSSAPKHFFCNSPLARDPLIVNLMASEPADVTLILTFSTLTTHHGESDTVHKLPTIQRNALLASFRVTQSMVDEEKASLVFKIRRGQKNEHPQRMGLMYVLPTENNSCIRDLLGGNADYHNWSGCFNVYSLTSCLEAKVSMSNGSTEPEMMKLTISDKASLPLSIWSKPSLTEGIWLVVFKLDPTADWEEMSAQLTHVYSRTLGSILNVMILVPIATVLGLVVINQRLKIAFDSVLINGCCASGEELRCRRTCRTCRELLFIDRDFRRFLVMRITNAFNGTSYAALLIVASSSLFIAAVQKAIADWQESQRSGSRDICHFNFECYHQWYSDFPINNCLSHLPYFCCGLFVCIVVLHSDYRATLKTCSGHLDLRVFYALAVAEIMEGCGSLVYHICPQKISFQFDSALMFAICLLSILALADVDERFRDSISPTGSLLLLIVPMWMISFIGTWFDLGVISNHYLYDAYSVLVLVWVFIVLFHASKLFPDISQWSQRLCLATMRTIAGVFMVVMLLKPDIRQSFGGMSRVLLIFSMGMMIFTCMRQIILHDVGPLSGLTQRSAFYLICRAPVKFGLFVVFLLASYFALLLYRKTPYKSGGQAWESRNKNQGCTLLNFFDSHDTWHMVSAIALALWTLVLLEIRLRIWKKQSSPVYSYELEGS